jgi:5'-AMP-activated protein kinase, catalytic alpha subunit
MPHPKSSPESKETPIRSTAPHTSHCGHAGHTLTLCCIVCCTLVLVCTCVCACALFSLYAGPEVDVWSCGVILYAIMCGSLPFDDENIRNLFRKIKGGVYTIPSYISKDARDLIGRMLVVDPLKRITIAEIRRHAWFLQDLPAYLAVSPEQQMEQSKTIDEDTLTAVVAVRDPHTHMHTHMHRTRNTAALIFN